MNDRDVTKPTLQERLEEIADLKRSIAARDAEIARLKAELLEAQQQRDHWKAAHTERGERVGERTREVLALRAERDDLRRRVGEMSGALSDAADIVRGIGKVGIWNQYLDHWDALRNTSGDQS